MFALFQTSVPYFGGKYCKKKNWHAKKLQNWLLPRPCKGMHRVNTRCHVAIFTAVISPKHLCFFRANFFFLPFSPPAEICWKLLNLTKLSKQTCVEGKEMLISLWIFQLSELFPRTVNTMIRYFFCANFFTCFLSWDCNFFIFFLVHGFGSPLFAYEWQTIFCPFYQTRNICKHVPSLCKF